MDSELLDFGVRALVGLFAVVDPLGNVPAFMTTTRAMSLAQRRRVALRAFAVSTSVLWAVALGGTGVMWMFDLTLPAVRIGGGIILLAIALQLLSGRQFDWERDRPGAKPGRSPERAAIVPLAIPLMAGPGAMASVLALTAQGAAAAYLGVIMLSILLVCAMGYVCYLGAASLINRLGRTTMVALSCLTGLILAALAVQFILDGLREAMPALFAPQ